MFAVLALVAFVVALFVYGSVHGWIFWLLLGLALLSISHVWDVVLPTRGVRHNHVDG